MRRDATRGLAEAHGLRLTLPVEFLKRRPRLSLTMRRSSTAFVVPVSFVPLGQRLGPDCRYRGPHGTSSPGADRCWRRSCSRQSRVPAIAHLLTASRLSSDVLCGLATMCTVPCARADSHHLVAAIEAGERAESASRQMRGPDQDQRHNELREIFRHLTCARSPGAGARDHSRRRRRQVVTPGIWVISPL
jgi:hypothetical protein